MSELESHQVRKLELEIAELARPLWLKPSFVTPLIAAALSIFVGYVTGWFNVQLTKLENKKFELQQEIGKFEAEKKEIKSVNSLLFQENSELKLNISNNVEKINKTTKEFERQISNLKVFYQAEITHLEYKVLSSSLTSALQKEEAKSVVKDLETTIRKFDEQIQKTKDHIRKQFEVDEDGCFSVPGEGTHCLNF